MKGKPLFSPKFIVCAIALAFLCFIPWVWAFYGGIIVYFPYEADGHSRFVRFTGPLHSDWLSAPELPKSCKQALVVAEDMRFYDHHGIDPQSIRQAIERNAKHGKRRIGASTITQQLVKNVFLSRKKTYLRKSREIAGAILLDVIMSKEHQLLWYFNVVEFGPRVYGLKQAAHYYFRKAPQKLNQNECIALVSLLPSPNRLSAMLKTSAASPAFKKRCKRIEKMVAKDAVATRTAE